MPVLLLAQPSPRLSACSLLNQVLASCHLYLLSHGHKQFRAFFTGIAPTKNVSIFLWTIPGIPGTFRRDKKKRAHSTEMCVHVWAILQKDASAPNGTVEWGQQPSINTTGTEADAVLQSPLSGTPSTWHKRPVQQRQVHPFHPNQFPWILSVPLFLVIKVPGITALWNSGKPQRQPLIFFKDVQHNSF